MNNCFSIYHTSWIKGGSKSKFICDNIQTKAILFFCGCSEATSTWLITSELANQRARKVLFTCVVYTKVWYDAYDAWKNVVSIEHTASALFAVFLAGFAIRERKNYTPYLRWFLRSKNYWWIFLLNILWMFPTKNCFEKYNKKIGHRPRKRDMMGQSCPIYACTRDNHVRYSSVHVTSCGSWKHSLSK